MAPVPTAQNTIPRRKPMRRFAFWKLGLAAPRRFWRAASNVLMQANMVVEERKFGQGLLKLRCTAYFMPTNPTHDSLRTLTSFCGTFFVLATIMASSGDLFGGDSVGSFGGDGRLLGNPVAVGSGAKWQYDQDYEAQGPFPLTFTRSYNSQAPKTASFIGAKWTANYFQSLRAAENADGSRQELPNALMITRPEGGWYQFDRQANNLYITKGNLPGSVERLTTGGNLSGWRYRTQLDTVEEFDVDGRLINIKDRAGLVHTLSYDTQKRVTQVEDSYGRTLKFSYGPSGYLQSLTDPSNRVTRYTHNEDGNLTQIDYFDATNKKYHYEDLENRFAITGMTDERGVRVTNYAYNDSGKVKEYQRAGEVERYQLRYEGNKTTVVDPLGTTRTYEYQVLNDRPYLKAVTQPCSACGSDASAKTYDARGLIDSETDFRGTVTKYERDSRAQVTRLIEAQGKPEQRVTLARYESQWHLPNRVEEPIAGGIRLRELTYDSEGNATTHKVTVGSEVRTTTRTFNANGQVLTEDGPRTDVTDKAEWTYNAQGFVATMTNAVGHVTTYNSYNADGQVTQMTDSNGLVTSYDYDARQRVTKMTEGTEVATYDYDDSGNLTKVTLPDASFLSYQFDDADRLISVTDARGQKMVYTLNGNGDRIKEETFGTGNSLAMTMSRVIDNLGRVESVTGAAANEITKYTYDPSGNEKTMLDPNQNLVKNDYDLLDRLTTVTDPDNNPVAFKYDPQDNLVEVSDPRQLKTLYGYSGFDELTKLTSPDTGVTDYTYDLSGNLKTRKDARNITATYQYDALDRIKQIVYPAITGANAQPAETLAFTYDEVAGGAGAKGRLTSVTDASGNTKYAYDDHGRVITKSQVVGTNTAKTQTISYLPTGQRNEHTLPSGAVVKYSYRADGRVVSIQVNGVTIVSELDYFPFGEVKSWKYNTADRYARVFDSNGRVKEHTAANATRAIAFDPGSRITSITDGSATANQWTYGYDNLDRLKSADNAGTTAGPLAQLKLGWTFDATGNRKTETRAIGAATPVPTAYTIDAASNKLGQVGSLARTYDAVGNTLADGAIASVYSARNRLIGATKAGVAASYQHNAFGERVSKTVAGVETDFVYDDDGHLLGEYRAAESTEYVWLGDVPVAVIKPQSFVASHAGKAAGSSAVFFVQPDHLDTPRVVVNAANAPVWKWDSAPFGDTLANEQPTASLTALSFNLRFPGQQFDTETDSHYNYFRDYEARTGNYVQSDPAGVFFDYQTYRYGSESPVKYPDPLGLGLIVRNSGGSIVYRDKSYAKPCPKGTPSQKGKAGEAAMLALAAAGTIPGLGASTGRTIIPPPSGMTGNSITDGTFTDASGNKIGMESKCGPCARPTKNQKQNKGNIGAAGLSDMFIFRFR
jgi:RHS repeat-associated protein